jgi:hypothetical protein
VSSWDTSSGTGLRASSGHNTSDHGPPSGTTAQGHGKVVFMQPEATLAFAGGRGRGGGAGDVGVAVQAQARPRVWPSEHVRKHASEMDLNHHGYGLRCCSLTRPATGTDNRRSEDCMCVRGGLEPPWTRIFPDSALEYAGGGEIPDRGFHAALVAGAPRPTSSGLSRSAADPGAAGPSGRG